VAPNPAPVHILAVHHPAATHHPPQPAQTAANHPVQLSEAAGPSTQPAAHSMKPPAPPSAASTPPVVRQPVQATKPSLSAEANTMSQYMAGTEIYLGTFWSAEQMLVTPVLRDPMTATSSTFRVAIVSSESCIRESSAATWSSGQKRSIAKSQLIFVEMTSSGSTSLNFTFSYRVGHS